MPKMRSGGAHMEFPTRSSWKNPTWPILQRNPSNPLMKSAKLGFSAGSGWKLHMSTPGPHFWHLVALLDFWQTCRAKIKFSVHNPIFFDVSIFQNRFGRLLTILSGFWHFGLTVYSYPSWGPTRHKNFKKSPRKWTNYNLRFSKNQKLLKSIKNSWNESRSEKY